MQVYLTSSGSDWWCAGAGRTGCGQRSSLRLPQGLLRPARLAPCLTAGLLLECLALTLPVAASWANPSHHLRSTPQQTIDQYTNNNCVSSKVSLLQHVLNRLMNHPPSKIDIDSRYLSAQSLLTIPKAGVVTSCCVVALQFLSIVMACLSALVVVTCVVSTSSFFVLLQIASYSI